MALNPRTWYPVAVIGFLVNVAGVIMAMSPAEPWHAGIHAALAVGFGAWAQRLGERRQAAMPTGERSAEVADLCEEVGELRGEMRELQERMDFAERMLTQLRDRERLPEGREEGSN